LPTPSRVALVAEPTYEVFPPLRCSGPERPLLRPESLASCQVRLHPGASRARPFHRIHLGLPLHRHAVRSSTPGAKAPSDHRCHPVVVFRPRGFSPPRQLAPTDGRRSVAPCSRSWGSLRFPLAFAWSTRRLPRAPARVPRSAIHPSKNTPRQQPYRVTAAVALLLLLSELESDLETRRRHRRAEARPGPPCGVFHPADRPKAHRASPHPKAPAARSRSRGRRNPGRSRRCMGDCDRPQARPETSLVSDVQSASQRRRNPKIATASGLPLAPASLRSVRRPREALRLPAPWLVPRWPKPPRPNRCSSCSLLQRCRDALIHRGGPPLHSVVQVGPESALRGPLRIPRDVCDVSRRAPPLAPEGARSDDRDRSDFPQAGCRPGLDSAGAGRLGKPELPLSSRRCRCSPPPLPARCQTRGSALSPQSSQLQGFTPLTSP